MARPFRQQADAEILDHASTLFAQHGFAQTSLKAVADAVGLSKAGLLHHFPTKEALYTAALEVAREQGRRVLDRLAALPPGRERDLRALELLTDIALDRPGLVALAFRTVTTPDAEPALDAEDMFVSKIFAVDTAVDAVAADPPERVVRVIGALSALAVLTLAANEHGEKTAWRPLIIATCADALGHRSPSPATSRHDQVEA
ncbi:TetR/AcrR family transcriptional regulator [Amycolatopsis sp. 195334CR]|uniref:TetR/AcrR family transcriptional regulator n=1 Tax=Amycolatopsis sp. 195334CR TaxID=2814588 RepID=UPI001A8CAE9D|nr:TetR/AcrR family transcriptional regulator [Amycolatopsis sp. 195334CR]MBN6033629.1 TetR/AcrR family transcriptional regulator [Amycolatopsis sp. 195334CR]